MGEGVLYRAAPGKVRFAIDSPVEGARSEPSVPRRERVGSVPSRLTPRVDLPRCRRGGLLTAASVTQRLFTSRQSTVMRPVLTQGPAAGGPGAGGGITE